MDQGIKTSDEKTSNGECVPMWYEIGDLKEQTTDICWKALKQSPCAIALIHTPTEEMCLYSVEHKPKLLKLIQPFQNEKICLAALKKSSRAIKYIVNQTHDMCFESIHRYPENIKYIKDPTIEMCREAIKKDGFCIEHFKEEMKTEELCLEDIELHGKDCGNLIQFMPQTPKICLATVKQHGDAIEYVKNQTIDLCLEALNQSLSSIMSIKDELLPEVIKCYKEAHPINFVEKLVENGLYLAFIDEDIQTLEMCMTAVYNNGQALKFVKNKTIEICKAAFDMSRNDIYWKKWHGDGRYLRFVKESEQTPEMCQYACDQIIWAFGFAKYQSREMSLEMVRRNGLALKYVKNKTPEVCLDAVLNCGDALKFVDSDQQTTLIVKKALLYRYLKYEGIINSALKYVIDQTDEICELSLVVDGRTLKFIRNPTDKLRRMAVESDGRALKYVDIEHKTPELKRLALKSHEDAIFYLTPH